MYKKVIYCYQPTRRVKMWQIKFITEQKGANKFAWTCTEKNSSYFLNIYLTSLIRYWFHCSSASKKCRAIICESWS